MIHPMIHSRATKAGQVHWCPPEKLRHGGDRRPQLGLPLHHQQLLRLSYRSAPVAPGWDWGAVWAAAGGAGVGVVGRQTAGEGGGLLG